MCCFAMIMLFFGPRTALFFWWIVGRTSWDNAWGDASYVFKALGFMFAPWTILMYLALGGEPINGWEWLWIGIGLLADGANWANLIWRRGRDVPTPYQQYVPADLR
jgi:hypothetical protein